MTALVWLPLALAGFVLLFTPLWFRTQNLPLALIAGILGGLLFFLWPRRLFLQGGAPWMLERLALWLLTRRGTIEPEELSALGGVPELKAREVLDRLVRRGLARKERGRYRR